MFQSFVYDLKCLFIRWGYKISLELDFYSMRFFIPVCKTVVYPFFYMWFTAVFWKMQRLSLSELHACLNNWHAWMINSNINLSMVLSTVQSTGAGRLSFVLLEGYWINIVLERTGSEPQALWAHHALLFILMFLKRQSLTRPTGKFSLFCSSQYSGICLDGSGNIIPKVNIIPPLWGLWGVRRWHSGAWECLHLHFSEFKWALLSFTICGDIWRNKMLCLTGLWCIINLTFWHMLIYTYRNIKWI